MSIHEYATQAREAATAARELHESVHDLWATVLQQHTGNGRNNPELERLYEDLTDVHDNLSKARTWLREIAVDCERNTPNA